MRRENSRGRSSASMREREQRQHRQHAADALAQEGSPRHACHAHVEGCDEQHIQRDIGNGGSSQKQEGRARIAQGSKDARSNVVKEQEHQPTRVDVEVEHGIVIDFHRGLNAVNQRRAKEEAHYHQHSTYGQAQQESSVDRRFHLPDAPSAEQPGRDHRCADIQPHGKGQINQRDLIAVAYGCQGLLTHEFSCHKAVSNVVELLKNDAAKQRERVAPQHPIRLALRQIHSQRNAPPAQKDSVLL